MSPKFNHSLTLPVTYQHKNGNFLEVNNVEESEVNESPNNLSPLGHSNTLNTTTRTAKSVSFLQDKNQEDVGVSIINDMENGLNDNLMTNNHKSDYKYTSYSSNGTTTTMASTGIDYEDPETEGSLKLIDVKVKSNNGEITSREGSGNSFGYGSRRSNSNNSFQGSNDEMNNDIATHKLSVIGTLFKRNTIGRGKTLKRLLDTKTVGFAGGITLLINGILGPGLIPTPQLYSESGFVLPTLTFVFFTIISTICAIFIIEAMQS